MFRNMTGFAECLDQVVGRVAIILDNEKTHDKSFFTAFLKIGRKALPADNNPSADAIKRGGGER
jgi:hypothetical protein